MKGAPPLVPTSPRVCLHWEGFSAGSDPPPRIRLSEGSRTAAHQEPPKEDRALSPSSLPNPRETLMRDLLSGHPHGAEQMRDRFRQIWPRMQTIRPATPPTPTQLAVLAGAQDPDTEAAIRPARESSSHALSLPPRPSLALTFLNKGAFFPCSSGSPHFRQTCACFLSAWAHLGLPPQAPPSPGDKPRIVFRDLINDNTPPPPATYPTSPPSSPFAR